MIFFNHSTTHAIAELVGEILQGFNDDMYTLALFIDLRKALDCVDHNILLNKLSNYGITGLAHDCFDSYLHNETLYTSINNNFSKVKNINIGVPQVSVLGPQLFPFIINDVCNSFRYGNSILFVDDTTIYIIGRNLWFLKQNMQAKHVNLSKWLHTNNLVLNIKKTKYMMIGPKSQ